MIVPPQAPGSVAGRTYRIRFSVAADGRVTRVEVDPPIVDEAYRREFLKRMLAYQFVPEKRDGRNVASVVTVTIQIGH
jgi:TonB family protein